MLRSLFVWIKVDLAAAAAAAAAFDSTFSALCGSKFASESASKHGNDCHKKNQENLIYYSRPRSEKNRESEKGLRKKEPIKLELCQWRALLSIFKANTWSTVDKVLGEVLKYRLCAYDVRLVTQIRLGMSSRNASLLVYSPKYFKSTLYHHFLPREEKDTVCDYRNHLITLHGCPT